MRAFGTAWMVILVITSCQDKSNQESMVESFEKDSLVLVQMIADREEAMIQKDMNLAMSQFAEDATWINSQGYFFEGKNEVEKFHAMLAGNDSLEYYYEAGSPRVRVLDANNSLAYYSWKMFWFRKENMWDTVIREIGLMTLHAQKEDGTWKWKAVTNQHTPWFYQKVEPVYVD